METETTSINGSVTIGTSGQKAELKRVLKTRDLVIFGMVFMAPVSAQTLFGSLAQVSQGHAVLSYIVGLVAMIFTAYSYGKMAEVFPIAGSTYSYTSRAIHPYVGFIAGWSMLLDYVLIPILLYKLSAIYAMELLPSIPLWLMLLLFVVPVTVFNCIGTQVASRVNIFMTIIMVLSIVLFVGFAIKALLHGVGVGSVFSMQGIYHAQTFTWHSLIGGASIAVLSFLGFDAVTTMAEDSSVSGKMVGKAAVLACVISAVLYVAQVYFATLTFPNFTAFQSPDTAFFEITTLVGGSGLATLLALIISLSGISTALAGQAAASRLLYGMGRERVLPKFFAHLHPKHKTPAYSILFMAATGYIGAVLIDLSVLFLIIVFGALIGFLCVNLSVFIEYYIKRQERSFTAFVPYVLFPLAGLVVCAYIMWGMDRIGHIVGGSWLVLGIIYLAIMSKGFTKKVEMFKEDSF
ncbi:L-asparagine transporter-like permease [Aneurinibacillus soli]|uniref:Putrescine importer PuuP n=1 Tax=Aneurinibacillus soli TaxID=1500254 RepID=A0A0U5AVS5_9BACL|nr:APC family permease [Aneurinibacillus soli]PYE61342.1 L-asparagine transporter-like permease [Aneurinibacillus soli]BAU27829.1 Putrescine importer PuuP [Aneurinibacillus soli]